VKGYHCYYNPLPKILNEKHGYFAAGADGILIKAGAQEIYVKFMNY